MLKVEWYSQGMGFMLALGSVLAVPLLLCAAPQTGIPSVDYSGAYSFLREGEFIQITVEDKGAVSGFISRFSDSEGDHAAFLDQFFKGGKLEGEELTFTTETVHGTWFEFEGILGRGPGKSPDEEGYFVARGILTRFNTDADKRTTSQSQRVEFKSFPRDAPN